MEILKIDTTDIIIDDYGNGKGKIIVSDTYSGYYSYYWGAMGGSLKSFIKNINSSYFAGKLCNNISVFSSKQTARNIRKYIREEMRYDLPWYKFMESQKDLRILIRDIERYSEDKHDAIHRIEGLYEDVNCFELSANEEREFRGILKDHFDNEPWLFLGEETSVEFNFLCKLHGELKKIL